VNFQGSSVTLDLMPSLSWRKPGYTRLGPVSQVSTDQRKRRRPSIGDIWPDNRPSQRRLPADPSTSTATLLTLSSQILPNKHG